MASIKSTIELYDRFSAPLLKVASAVSKTEQVMAHMNEQMSRSAGSEKFGEARRQVEETTAAVSKLTGGLSGVSGAAASAGEHIQGGAQAQAKLNRELERGTNLASRLGSTLKAAFGAYMGIAGIKKTVAFISDSLAAFDNQLNAETQLGAVLANNLEGSYTAAFDRIKSKAAEIQKQGIYGDESMIAAGAEFATYFKDADAITKMMDTLSNYAMGMSGGGAIDKSAMVDYATNLGKIMTGAYDAMTKKGFEFTDAQKAVIEGVATNAQYIEVLGDEWQSMTDDMRSAAAISQVIDESWAGLYEKMSNTPQGKIIQLTNAWGDMKEVIGGRLYPIVVKFVETINNNWGTIETVVNGITTALSKMLTVASKGFNVVASAGAFMAEHWGTIGPIIGGVTLALLGLKAASLAYTAVLAVQNGLQGAAAFMDSVRAASLQISTGATFMATAAQYGFNAALLACPLTWIILAVIALVAVIFILANALAKTTDVAMTGFGLIAGGINVVIQWFKNLGLTVANIALGIWNAVSALAHNMVTAFSNAIANIKSVFYGLLATAMSVISQIAAALSKLPFVEFDASGLQAAAKGYAAKSAEAQASKGTYKDVGAAFSSGMGTFNTFAAGWEASAFSAGAAWGDGVMGKTSFGGAGMSMDDFGAGALASEVGNLADGVGGIANNAGGIADDVGGMAKDLSITKDELKYLRDIAEQEAVNRFTTAEIKVDMSGMQNIIDNSNDIDGIVDALTGAVGEAVEMIAAGVHV